MNIDPTFFKNNEYYWVINKGFDLKTGEDKIIKRPVLAIVITEDDDYSVRQKGHGHFLNDGVYFQMIGSTEYFPLERILEWKDLSFKELNMPLD